MTFVEQLVADLKPIQEAELMDTVYFVGIEGRRFVKIGWSRGVDPKPRLAALQVASPQRLEVLLCICGGIRAEQLLHSRFRHCRQRAEWFRYREDLTEFIELGPELMGCPLVRRAPGLRKRPVLPSGSVYQRTYRDREGVIQRTETWSVKFYVDGVPIRRSTGVTDYEEAVSSAY